MNEHTGQIPVEPVADSPTADTSSAESTASISMLERFLATDPRDIGCEQAMALLHVYAEMVLTDGHNGCPTGSDGSAQDRYSRVAAHLRACGPCGEDFEGLLAAVNGTGS